MKDVVEGARHFKDRRGCDGVHALAGGGIAELAGLAGLAGDDHGNPERRVHIDRFRRAGASVDRFRRRPTLARDDDH